MISRAKIKPTAWEFFARLGFRREDAAKHRRYYCTLRRRGLGQTCALLGATLATGYRLADIVRALGGSYRVSCRNRAKIRKRFGISGVVELVAFLEDPSAWPEGRRSKPTPQERPFSRPPAVVETEPTAHYPPLRITSVANRATTDGSENCRASTDSKSTRTLRPS